ncbi:hypothetical protein [Thiolapillus brandeum]|uniref:Uncharacterized protein n=1 Tax=Thiolapillus brandeum TaxID=1076588 RepID=A0A7U6JJ06_9GAMM|nr:hypothetical protein [Thiolapillus brandeum]BAO44710.1 conserved hypothetical protein [Thiolapillus brandeum]
MKPATIAMVVALSGLAGSAQASVIKGHFVGTIGEATFDETIVCLGKPSPDSFFQSVGGASSGANQEVKISGGRSGKHLNLVVEGKGVVLRTRVANISMQGNKLVYQETRKLKNGKTARIDLKLWCE